MEKDALNRIKWDSQLNPEEFEIHYLDRKEDKLLKVNFSDIELQGDFFQYHDNLIPLHRIRKILWKGKVVWNKRRI